MKLENFIFIKALREQVYTFFEIIEEYFCCLHSEYLPFEWRKSEGLKRGNVFYFEEKGGRHFMGQVHLGSIGPIGKWMYRKDYATFNKNMQMEGEKRKQMIENKTHSAL
jgi:hypothetical protein